MKNYLPSTKNIVLILITLLCVLVPSLVLAQTTGGFFDVDPNDVAKKSFIDYLAGPLTNPTGTSPFGDVIGIFNGAVLTMGGIYLAYIYITGTAQGAHDGQFLGKRWSSMWVPIRMLMGAVLAFPSLKGGFCLAQWLVFWLALQGVGFANMIWKAYVGNIYGGIGAPALASTSRPYAIARQMFLNNLCVDLFSNTITGQGGANAGVGDAQYQNNIKALFGKISFGVNNTPISDDNLSSIYNYRAQSGSIFSNKWVNAGMHVGAGAIVTSSQAYKNASGSAAASVLGGNLDTVCGTASFTAANDYKAVSQNGDGSVIGTEKDSNWAGSEGFVHYQAQVDSANQAAQEVAKSFDTIHSAELKSLQTATATLAKQYADSTTPDQIDVSGQLGKLAQTYADSLTALYSTSVSNLSGSSEDFKAKVAQDGFIMAGAFYVKIANLKNIIDTALQNYPQVTGSNVLSDFKMVVETSGWDSFKNWAAGDTSLDQNKAAIKMLTVQVIPTYNRAIMASKNPYEADSPFGTAGVSTTTDAKDYNSFISKLFSDSTTSPNAIFSFLGINNASNNSLFLARDIGEKMLSVAWMILAIGLAGSFINGAIGTLAISLWVAFSVPGAMLSTVLPMLPFMIWIGSVFSWFVLLIEALIAAPLWAIAHLTPDGEGFQGGAKNGYMLILNLTLRPALMIFGLIAAIIAMAPIGMLINTTFGFAFASAANASTGMNKISSLIAGCALYALMMITSTKKVFELIHLVPERIMRWMGGHGDNLGHAQEFGHGAEMIAAKGMQGMNSIGQGAVRAVGATGGSLKKLASKGKDDGNDPGGAGRASASAERAHMQALGSSQDDPGANDKAAARHMGEARAHETNAKEFGKKDSNFNTGLKSAEMKDATAGYKADHPNSAVKAFMESQTEKAAMDQHEGKTLKPHQEELLKADASKGMAAGQTAEAVRKRLAMEKNRGKKES